MKVKKFKNHIKAYEFSIKVSGRIEVERTGGYDVNYIYYVYYN